MTNDQKRELRKRLSNGTCCIETGYEYAKVVEILALFMLENEDVKSEVKACIDSLEPYLYDAKPNPYVLINPCSLNDLLRIEA